MKTLFSRADGTPGLGRTSCLQTVNSLLGKGSASAGGLHDKAVARLCDVLGLEAEEIRQPIKKEHRADPDDEDEEEEDDRD